MKENKAIVRIEKIGGSEEQAQWAMEIYKQCGTIDAVYTVEAESGFRHDVVSAANSNGTRDYYLFQFNSQWHWPFISSVEGKDPYKQIEYGCNLWRGYVEKGIPLGSRWYAYNVIHKRPGVKDRFIIHYE